MPKLPSLPKPPKLNDLPSSFPEEPPPGPFQKEFWHSPLRGPWMTSFLGSALLPLIVICAITGFLSHVAYHPDLGSNSVTGTGGIGVDLYFFSFPTSPTWLYALTQGLHIASGLSAIPILFAKLWSAMPKLFEWPPMRSLSHILDRLSLALLVGGSLFVFFTGVLNIQLWYPWKFSFVPAHYYGAFIFLAALGLHLVTKVPIALKAFREKGVFTPLKDDLAHTKAEPYAEDSTTPHSPKPATMSRRGLIGMVGAGSLGLAIMAGGQIIGGPFRKLAFLAPRGKSISDGPNGFLINRTFEAAVIEETAVGDGWRLKLDGAQKMELTREQLLAMPQQTYSLPIACVEGWSTTQSWTGVPLRDLAELAGAPTDSELLTTSLQTEGGFSQATLSGSQVSNEKALLALKVNGEDLSFDHGFPARIISPATPGVHCTKWVSTMSFEV
ncbi:molybdopterin-dependent oxidoreductase [soil metagenome]